MSKIGGIHPESHPVLKTDPSTEYALSPKSLCEAISEDIAFWFNSLLLVCYCSINRATSWSIWLSVIRADAVHLEMCSGRDSDCCCYPHTINHLLPSDHSDKLVGDR
ncbi:hypothetical protein Fot_37354 [Forsythia ovata]|uniref:Uncharacterized protein n=1 Tax=Forsythia ovata TaxID=205694 RepID=A0ABD1S139_9LAMI